MQLNYKKLAQEHAQNPELREHEEKIIDLIKNKLIDNQVLVVEGRSIGPRGGHFHIKLYGTYRFSGYHFSA